MKTPTEPERLRQLADEWARRARVMFRDAELLRDPLQQRALEHAATCYANCVIELREAIQC